jgi:hypothetical protein
MDHSSSIAKNAIYIIYNFLLFSKKKKSEDTKGVIRSYKSKETKYDC